MVMVRNICTGIRSLCRENAVLRSTVILNTSQSHDIKLNGATRTQIANCDCCHFFSSKRKGGETFLARKTAIFNESLLSILYKRITAVVTVKDTFSRITEN